MEVSRRSINALGLLLCALLLGYAYYAQYVQGLEPCPLCILQRMVMSFLALVFLVGWVHPAGRVGSRVYAILIAVVALAGLGVAARHVYIQSLPEGSVAACGAPLEVLLQMSPVLEVLRKVLTGSGECATVTWRFLGLTMPAWLIGWFLLFGVVGFIANWRGALRVWNFSSRQQR